MAYGIWVMKNRATGCTIFHNPILLGIGNGDFSVRVRFSFDSRSVPTRFSLCNGWFLPTEPTAPPFLVAEQRAPGLANTWTRWGGIPSVGILRYQPLNPAAGAGFLCGTVPAGSAAIALMCLYLFVFHPGLPTCSAPSWYRGRS